MKWVRQLSTMFYYSPVRKYRKNYCSRPGVGASVGVAQMLKILVKGFVSLYLLKLLMDQNDPLHVGRYWSEALCTTHLGYLEVKVKELNFCVKDFSLSFTMYIS